MADIFEALIKDHEVARDIMRKLEKTEGASAERQEHYPKLVKELLAHAKAEERTLYHAMLGSAESQDEATHSIGEHQDMEEAMEALAKTEMSSSQWLPKFRELRELTEHHMKEEEQEIFEAARDVLSTTRQNELGSQYEKEKVVEDKKDRSDFLP
ncbi:hemerythrin domain-containing protein [Allohahella marinimesophila]|uniref:Hemerythrin domain-containing protein n=1 Tax=Allohahella marinimesophila TaxID=1054972 RepID=A0ABP7PXM3_9GAMM